MILLKENCFLYNHYMKTLPNYWNLNAETKNQIARNSVDYIFKLSNATQFKNNLKILANTDIVMPAQKTLISKGNITKDLKVYLMQRCAGVKADKIGESSKIFNLLSDTQIKNLTQLSKTAILNKSELDNLILKCLDNCRVYTIKFVKHSMTFLIRTGEHSLEDMCNLFLLEGLQSLLFVYPRFENELHATNIMKATIHNVGQNYIETHTRLKRNRYDENGMMKVDSFTGIDSETNSITEKTFSTEDSLGRLYTKDNTEISQLESAVVELSSKFKGTKLRIISLLSGNYDKEFTLYLNSRGTTKFPNDDYFEIAKPNRYNKLVFEYVGYSKERAERFLCKLKKSLSGYQ